MIHSRTNIKKLEDIPNVGAAAKADLELLGIRNPQELINQDPYALFETLCTKTGFQHDPCVIDVFISAVRFMEGGPPKKWWEFTQERKTKLNRTRSQSDAGTS